MGDKEQNELICKRTVPGLDQFLRGVPVYPRVFVALAWAWAWNEDIVNQQCGLIDSALHNLDSQPTLIQPTRCNKFISPDNSLLCTVLHPAPDGIAHDNADRRIGSLCLELFQDMRGAMICLVVEPTCPRLFVSPLLAHHHNQDQILFRWHALRCDGIHAIHSSAGLHNSDSPVYYTVYKQQALVY